MRTKMRYVLPLLFVLLVFAVLPLKGESAFAGDGAERRLAAVVYDNSSGLPFSEANTAVQTPDGFIYIGSYGGLTRFDGQRFEPVSGVSSAVCLFVDSAERLWVGTSEMGAVCIDGGTQTVYGPEQGLESSSVRGFYEEPDGSILMATRSGLFVLDNAAERVRAFSDARFAGKYIISLTGDSFGNAYIVVRNEGYFRLRGEEVTALWLFVETGFDAEVICPDPDREGYVWFGTEGSELFYGSMDAPISALRRIGLDGITGVNSILPDRERLWVCAGDGMGYLEDGAFTRLEHLPVTNAYEAIMRDAEGNLWVSSSRRGVMKLYPSIFTDISAVAGLGNRVVNAVSSAGGKLYIGTDTGLVVTDMAYNVVDDPASALLRDAMVRSITSDSHGMLWFSTYSRFGLVRMDPKTGKYECYNRENGLASDYVRDTLHQAGGETLIAASEGFYSLGADGTLREYGADEGLTATVLCMCETPDGTVFLGTDGAGVFTLRDGALKPFDTGKTLRSGVILSIKYDAARSAVWLVTGQYELAWLRDGALKVIETLPAGNKNAGPYYDLLTAENGRLWLLGCRGICVVSGDGLMAGDVSDAVYYGPGSGLPHVFGANARSFVTEEETAFLAGVDGVTGVSLRDVQRDTSDPRLCIPYVDIDGVRIWPGESGQVSIPKNAKSIKIYAYALTYTQADPEVYYALEGFDTENSVSAASRLPVVTYTNLPGGDYTFRLSLPGTDGAKELRLRLEKEKRLYEYRAVRVVGEAVLLALFGWLISRLLKRQKKRLEAKGEEARINSELNMAAGIQADMLPQAFPAFPGRSEFDVYASMQPAKEVGGDFYDYFLIDSDHLALAVADVSGKGIPAALFMTMAKTLLKSRAMHTASPAQVLWDVNARLCENNETNMFVTVWLGILELSTGVLTWADAGHEKPLLCHKGGWMFLSKHSGVALGLMEPELLELDDDPPFVDQTLCLQPDDMLLQYTDGVPEATDPNEKLFGEDRLLEAVRNASGGELKAVTEHVQREIDAFVGKAQQFDDITMLILRYRGGGGDNTRQVQG